MVLVHYIISYLYIYFYLYLFIYTYLSTPFECVQDKSQPPAHLRGSPFPSLLDMRPDFVIVAGRNLDVKYNYGSILHYGPYAFSKEPGVKKTIVPKDPKADIKDPWERTEMAPSDALYIHQLYRGLCQVNVTQR